MVNTGPLLILVIGLPLGAIIGHLLANRVEYRIVLPNEEMVRLKDRESAEKLAAFLADG